MEIENEKLLFDIFKNNDGLQLYQSVKRFIIEEVKKENCKICGDKQVEIHHPDYKNPFKILWLCKKHHSELHNKLKAN